MSTTRLLVPLFGFFGVLCGLVTADAGLPKPKVPTSPECTQPAPTKEVCLSIVNKTKDNPGRAYIETACGKKYKSTCQPFFDEVMQHNRPGCKDCQGDACNTCGSPDSKVLSTKGSEMPKDLRTSYRGLTYAKPKKGSDVTARAHHVLARAKLSRPPGSKETDPAHTMRNPEWDKDKKKIGSCDEFAYDELYDAMRFIDAAAACAGDYWCEMDIAYLPTTPGVANRKLLASDGSKLKLRKLEDKWVDTGEVIERLEVMTDGAIAKNDMFAAIAGVAYAGDMINGNSQLTATADLDALAATLDHGKGWYAFGASRPRLAPIGGGKTKTISGGGRNFTNEWEFHSRMRASHTTLSDAEFAEFDRRKTELRRLLDELDVARHAGCEAWRAKGNSVDCANLEIIRGNPVTDPTYDSMDRNRVVRNDPPPRRRSAPAVGVLAIPTKAAPASQKSTGGKMGKCDPRKWGSLDDANIADFFVGGPAACKVGELLRAEWARKAAGQASCLDTESDACDWSPGMFHRRFVAGFKLAHQQAKLEDVCKKYTGGSFDPQRKSLSDTREHIAKMKRKIGAALRKLDPYTKKYDRTKIDSIKFAVFGDSWSDNEDTGDKDWFAAGYHYNLGWKVGPERLHARKDKDGNVLGHDMCRISGQADSEVDAHAWFAGNKVNLLKASVHLDVNKGDNGKTALDANLVVININISDFIKAAEALSKAFHGGDQGIKGPGISFTVVLGGIPVTGAIWGELDYGADFGLHHKISAGCDPKKVGFTANASFDPHIGVDGKAQVGVGVSGVLSAGVRTSVELLTIGVPLDLDFDVGTHKMDGQDVEEIDFDAGIDLRLSTLSGYVAIYLEELMFSQEFRVFSWSGVSSKIPLMPKLETKLPLFAWPSEEVKVEE